MGTIPCANLQCMNERSHLIGVTIAGILYLLMAFLAFLGG
jgi:hypothetical protein